MLIGEKAKGVRRSRAEWRELLGRFSASGLGVEAFCRRELISTASFYRWRNTLRAGRDGGSVVVRAASPAFVDLGGLSTQSSPRAQLDLRLDLGEGVMLHLVRS